MFGRARALCRARVACHPVSRGGRLARAFDGALSLSRARAREQKVFIDAAPEAAASRDAAGEYPLLALVRARDPRCAAGRMLVDAGGTEVLLDVLAHPRRAAARLRARRGAS